MFRKMYISQCLLSFVSSSTSCLGYNIFQKQQQQQQHEQCHDDAYDSKVEKHNVLPVVRSNSVNNTNQSSNDSNNGSSIRSHNSNNNNNNHTMMANAFGSACSGIISRIFTHPLDTAKARLQATSSYGTTYKGPIDVLIRTFNSSEGLRGLYGGFGTVIVAGTPGTVLYLCTYEYMKETLLHYKQQQQAYNTSITDNNDTDFVIHFTAGMIAETIACIIYVPVDVIKVVDFFLIWFVLWTQVVFVIKNVHYIFL